MSETDLKLQDLEEFTPGNSNQTEKRLVAYWEKLQAAMKETENND